MRKRVRELAGMAAGGLALALMVPSAARANGDNRAMQGDTEAESAIGSHSVTTASYPPDFFNQFAPRTALDMLSNVPGFAIREQFNQRGLGQASANVLVNGERLGGKSDTIQTQLARIPASRIIRIDIVDGSTLNLPGLSGQVANVLVRSGGVSGQFSWEPQAPTRYALFRWSEGSISVTGSAGPVDYTLALSNTPFRGGTGGDTILVDGSGTLFETRQATTQSRNDYPKISGQFRFGNLGAATANLGLSYQHTIERSRELSDRFYIDQPDGAYSLFNRRDGHAYEINADIDFPLGPGRLKLIGLESYRSSDFSTQERLDFGLLADPAGTRFELASASGERIIRAEYNLPLFGADWQWSGEAAFNRLDNVAGLFVLDPASDELVPVPFPSGTGGVTEDRYEMLLTYGRNLNEKLSFQVVSGAEFSRIAQTGAGAARREFWRPKGSATLSWTPGGGFDANLRVEREVGQLNFADFLADVNLAENNTNSGNNQLVPEQSWLFEVVANQDLGAWGSATVRLFYRSLQDLVTIVPLPGGLEARGNVPSAWRMGVDLTTTLNLDPVGIAGAKFDISMFLRETELTDPVTGQARPHDFIPSHDFYVDFRHDIPQSDWAWGINFRRTNPASFYRVREFGQNYNVDTFGAVFVEHKDVLGLTVRARAGNLLGGGAIFRRTVYEGLREQSPVAFFEDQDRKIGTVWTFVVKGDF